MEVAATVAAHDFELTIHGFHDVGGGQRTTDGFGVIEESQVVLALFAKFSDEGGISFGKAVAAPSVAGFSAACRSSSPASYSPLLAVWAFIALATNTPAADFCHTVRMDRSTLSHGSVTCSRSPEVSSIAFHAQ